MRCRWSTTPTGLRYQVLARGQRPDRHAARSGRAPLCRPARPTARSSTARATRGQPLSTGIERHHPGLRRGAAADAARAAATGSGSRRSSAMAARCRRARRSAPTTRSISTSRCIEIAARHGRGAADEQQQCQRDAGRSSEREAPGGRGGRRVPPQAPACRRAGRRRRPAPARDAAVRARRRRPGGPLRPSGAARRFGAACRLGLRLVVVRISARAPVLIIATIGSASARPISPNRAPNRSCAPSTRARAPGRPSSSRRRARSDSRRRSGRRHRRAIAQSPASTLTEKPASTISTPEMIAPILGRKASRPVRMPSKAAIGTPPISSSSQVPTPSTAMPISRPTISRRSVKPIRSAVR